MSVQMYRMDAIFLFESQAFEMFPAATRFYVSSAERPIPVDHALRTARIGG